MKTKNTQKTLKQGFTLLELLVVVLIIGILAAIALPQYQMAVGRAKFSTVKNLTKSLAEARNRFVLTNDTYPSSINDLDIGLQIKNESYSPESWFKFTTLKDVTCTVWITDTFNSAATCGYKILGKDMRYYVSNNALPQKCLVYNEDDNDLSNKLCQQETGKKTGDCNNSAGWCQYYY